jgi:hypothetical protein
VLLCVLLHAGSGSGSPKKEKITGDTGLMLSRTDTSLSVALMDWVVQFSHLLLLTRGLSVRSYPCTVRAVISCGGANCALLKDT